MKKHLIGGIVAAAALAAPNAASATHIAGATYTGPVTTGSGGTATVVVSGDGQSLSFHAQNIGNGSSCTGVSFGPVTDIPISNHSFSYLSNDGLISASGTFGAPGDVRACDVHISNLRQKIEQDPQEPELVLTVRGVGYRLAEPG